MNTPAFTLLELVDLFNQRFGQKLDAAELDWMQIDNMATWCRDNGEGHIGYFLKRHADLMKGQAQ